MTHLRSALHLPQRGGSERVGALGRLPGAVASDAARERDNIRAGRRSLARVARDCSGGLSPRSRRVRVRDRLLELVGDAERRARIQLSQGVVVPNSSTFRAAVIGASPDPGDNTAWTIDNRGSQSWRARRPRSPRRGARSRATGWSTQSPRCSRCSASQRRTRSCRARSATRSGGRRIGRRGGDLQDRPGEVVPRRRRLPRPGVGQGRPVGDRRTTGAGPATGSGAMLPCDGPQWGPSLTPVTAPGHDRRWS